jgi:D-alanyl-D-alanine carboxypeptidase
MLRIAAGLLVLILAFSGASCGRQTPEGGVSGGETGKAKDSEPASPFEGFYYYEEERADRYAEFALQRPDLDAEVIVWMVDADLDRDVYTDPVTAKAPESLTALVNKHVRLPEDYVPEDLVDIDLTTLRAEAANALKQMQGDAEEEELTLIAQSGFRTYARQKELYDGYRRDDPEGADTYSSRPGHSEHQTGLAIDVNIANVGNRDFVGTPEAAWVLENGWRYGYIVRYTPENGDFTSYESEPWHLRYIGVENATRMQEEGILSFEEYWVKYVAHLPPQ